MPGSLRSLRQLLCPVSKTGEDADEAPLPPLPADPAQYPENRLGEFWRGKLRSSFRRLNRSGSGVLTRADFVDIGAEMARLGSLDGQRAADVLAVMLSIWEDYYRPRGAQGEDGSVGVTVEQYVEQKCRLVNGPLRADIARYGRCLFRAMDHDGDGRISRDEYRIFTRAWGIGDRARDEAFELMMLAGGGEGVSEAAFIGALADFYISEDPRSPYARLFGEIDSD